MNNKTQEYLSGFRNHHATEALSGALPTGRNSPQRCPYGLYAEQLADELGAYESDPVGRLGYLQSIAFRACRLVVDTGLHAKGWTREEGVRFFVDVNGSNPLEVASEVDRYCAWPGQACGYKVGHSEINRQRQRAQAALGTRYDLRAFNDTVVRGGNVPLDVLARNVDEYLRA